jgi:hypothetical protein
LLPDADDCIVVDLAEVYLHPRGAKHFSFLLNYNVFSSRELIAVMENENTHHLPSD